MVMKQQNELTPEEKRLSEKIRRKKRSHTASSVQHKKKLSSSQPISLDDTYDLYSLPIFGDDILFSALIMHRAELEDSMLHPDLLRDINKFQLEEYAKKHFNIHKKGALKKRTPIREMLSYTKGHLPSSLLKHASDKTAKEAVKLFKSTWLLLCGLCAAPERALVVRGYMEQKIPKKATEDELAIDVVWLCMRQTELRDELYCQLAKQTTFNPSREASFRCWELFVFSVLNFPPSTELEPHLVRYWEEHLKVRLVLHGAPRGRAGSHARW